jgi:hypothetical protein
MARVDGIRVAPATPRTARAAISCPALPAYAAPREVAEKPAAPISSSRRGPTRSATAPMATSRPASTKPYTSKIQSCWVAEARRSRLIPGTAKYRIDTSIDTSSSGSASTPSATHSRRPAFAPRVSFMSTPFCVSHRLFT